MKLERTLYKGQCLVCHTVDGWREKRAFANRVDGWSEESIDTYISTLHEARPFMPPFVGTEEERSISSLLISCR